MLYSINDDGFLKEMLTLPSHPHCSLFEQKLDGDSIIVTYLRDDGCTGSDSDQDQALRVPLDPSISSLETVVVDMHGSSTRSYNMGEPYNAWFSAKLGFKTALLYLGDGRRAVLGTIAPSSRVESQNPPTLLSSVASYLTGWSIPSGRDTSKQEWITFADIAPFLVTSESSLTEVSSRIHDQTATDMRRFRPNIVVSGEGAWAEDFWQTLAVNGRPTFELTANCARCTSINVDYEIGKPAEGEAGSVLKKLMKDRRVDTGNKWEPIFGRLGFLIGGEGDGAAHVRVSVGDHVQVTRRREARDVWDWPSKSERLAATQKV
jgi:uncharacterized protein YcbX